MNCRVVLNIGNCKQKESKVKTIINIILISFFLSGCATPGIRATAGDTYIQITPMETEGIKGFFAWFFKPKLPAGTYKAKIDDKELEIDTKKDLKLIDINLNKQEK